MEWFGLEDAFKDHLVQPPCHRQRHLPIDYLDQSPLQNALDTSSDMGHLQLLWTTCLVSHYP